MGSRFHITASISSAAERDDCVCAASGAMPESTSAASTTVRSFIYALKINLLPVDVLMTLPGICARASSRKFSPLQCIGISTSGSSFLTSATTSLR